MDQYKMYKCWYPTSRNTPCQFEGDHATVISHMPSHTNFFYHKCRICGKRFEEERFLDLHENLNKCRKRYDGTIIASEAVHKQAINDYIRPVVPNVSFVGMLQELCSFVAHHFQFPPINPSTAPGTSAHCQEAPAPDCHLEQLDAFHPYHLYLAKDWRRDSRNFSSSSASEQLESADSHHLRGIGETEIIHDRISRSDFPLHSPTAASPESSSAHLTSSISQLPSTEPRIVDVSGEKDLASIISDPIAVAEQLEPVVSSSIGEGEEFENSVTPSQPNELVTSPSNASPSSVSESNSPNKMDASDSGEQAELACPNHSDQLDENENIESFIQAFSTVATSEFSSAISSSTSQETSFAAPAATAPECSDASNNASVTELAEPEAMDIETPVASPVAPEAVSVEPSSSSQESRTSQQLDAAISESALVSEQSRPVTPNNIDEDMDIESPVASPLATEVVSVDPFISDIPLPIQESSSTALETLEGTGESNSGLTRNAPVSNSEQSSATWSPFHPVYGLLGSSQRLAGCNGAVPADSFVATTSRYASSDWGFFDYAPINDSRNRNNQLMPWFVPPAENAANSFEALLAIPPPLPSLPESSPAPTSPETPTTLEVHDEDEGRELDREEQDIETAADPSTPITQPIESVTLDSQTSPCLSDFDGIERHAGPGTTMIVDDESTPSAETVSVTEALQSPTPSRAASPLPVPAFSLVADEYERQYRDVEHRDDRQLQENHELVITVDRCQSPLNDESASSVPAVPLVSIVPPSSPVPEVSEASITPITSIPLAPTLPIDVLAPTDTHAPTAHSESRNEDACGRPLPVTSSPTTRPIRESSQSPLIGTASSIPMASLTPTILVAPLSPATRSVREVLKARPTIVASLALVEQTGPLAPTPEQAQPVRYEDAWGRPLTTPPAPPVLVAPMAPRTQPSLPAPPTTEARDSPAHSPQTAPATLDLDQVNHQGSSEKSPMPGSPTYDDPYASSASRPPTPFGTGDPAYMEFIWRTQPPPERPTQVSHPIQYEAPDSPTYDEPCIPSRPEGSSSTRNNDGSHNQGLGDQSQPSRAQGSYTRCYNSPTYDDPIVPDDPPQPSYGDEDWDLDPKDSRSSDWMNSPPRSALDDDRISSTSAQCVRGSRKSSSRSRASSATSSTGGNLPSYSRNNDFSRNHQRRRTSTSSNSSEPPAKRATPESRSGSQPPSRPQTSREELFEWSKKLKQNAALSIERTTPRTTPYQTPNQTPGYVEVDEHQRTTPDGLSTHQVSSNPNPITNGGDRGSIQSVPTSHNQSQRSGSNNSFVQIQNFIQQLYQNTGDTSVRPVHREPETDTRQNRATPQPATPVSNGLRQDRNPSGAQGPRSRPTTPHHPSNGRRTPNHQGPADLLDALLGAPIGAKAQKVAAPCVPLQKRKMPINEEDGRARRARLSGEQSGQNIGAAARTPGQEPVTPNGKVARGRQSQEGTPRTSGNQHSRTPNGNNTRGEQTPGAAPRTPQNQHPTTPNGSGTRAEQSSGGTSGAEPNDRSRAGANSPARKSPIRRQTPTRSSPITPGGQSPPGTIDISIRKPNEFGSSRNVSYRNRSPSNLSKSPIQDYEDIREIQDQYGIQNRGTSKTPNARSRNATNLETAPPQAPLPRSAKIEKEDERRQKRLAEMEKNRKAREEAGSSGIAGLSTSSASGAVNPQPEASGTPLAENRQNDQERQDDVDDGRWDPILERCRQRRQRQREREEEENAKKRREDREG